MDRTEFSIPTWPVYLLLLGLYLTLRGYHSFDGDQAYRLPLLLHRQDPSLYASDPFVRSLDEFNPHRGSIALLDLASRPLGLPAALFVVFVLTFFGTCWGVARLAAAVRPDRRPEVGWVAVGLFLVAKAGNIGTNHLFEAMVLDRLVALALGWIAVAEMVTGPQSGWWRAAIAISLATVVHPSVGLQLAMLVSASWTAWAVFGGRTRVSRSTPLRGLLAIGLAIGPGLTINLTRGSSLMGDVPAPLFWVLSVELQNPQHMLPHLWRFPQWLAWSAYLVMAGLAMAPAGWAKSIGSGDGRPQATDPATGSTIRFRLAIMLAVLLLGLGMAWIAIEGLHNIPATIFQPFRMATVVRGLALVLISGRLVDLWASGGPFRRTRAAVLAASFLGDWRLVVAASGEIAVSSVEIMRRGFPRLGIPHALPGIVYSLAIARGLIFLGHHDTESGLVPLLCAAGIGGLAGLGRWSDEILARLKGGRALAPAWRCAVVLAGAWVVPTAALLAALVPTEHPEAPIHIVRGLVDRCRFYPMPLDDIERLASWCRDHTPPSARFIGPPGPKTFRLWSRRSLAFNRSGSPYHGAGLLDWFARFQDHVGDHGPPAEFVRDYRAHRHEFEARYDRLDDDERAELARRQGADYVIAPAPKGTSERREVRAVAPLEFLHAEGRYAVYRVRPSTLAHRQP